MKIEYLFFIPLLLELLAAVIASVTYKKYSESNEKYFLYFLWYTLLVELTGDLVGYAFSADNFWLYNGFTITSFLFYFYWYYNILKRKRFKRTIVVFTVVFLLVAIYSLIYEDWSQYHSYTFITGASFVLVLTLFHFYKLLNSDEVLIVKYKLSFWISTALLLFYMGMIPLMFLTVYADLNDVSYLIIMLSMNLILYGCYIIGFLWTKKAYNRF
jgi:hypothetical protein